MRAVCLLTAALLVPAVLAAQTNGSVSRAVHSITPEDIAHRIGVLAHDSMRGRDTPSPELEQTAEYIAAEFRRFGLKPGGDHATFIQRYTIRHVYRHISIEVTDGPAWQGGVDVIRLGGGSSPDGASGPTVLLAGSGMPSNATSLRGAIVIYLPEGYSRASLGVIRDIARLDPAAVLVVAEFSERMWSFSAGRQRRAQLATGWSTPSTTPPQLGIRDATARDVLAKRGVDLAALRTAAASTPVLQELPDLDLTVTVRERTASELTAPNVVGMLKGSDPVLKNEYITFSAHMDHVGVGPPSALAGRFPAREASGDTIYNGADDDASGTAAVIELAEAFAMLSPRPKRSMIFLTVSGEEKRLWGSDYFGSHPPVSIDRIVANLNIDMIGRNWTDTVVVIGKEHSDLGATLNRVNARHPELNMTAIDDIWPEERFYFRSDHYNFAKRGVPILFFFTGTHEDYHRPSDHVEKINAEKESRIAKLVFYLGLEVANAGARPKWNPESYRQIVPQGQR